MKKKEYQIDIFNVLQMLKKIHGKLAIEATHLGCGGLMKFNYLVHKIKEIEEKIKDDQQRTS